MKSPIAILLACCLAFAGAAAHAQAYPAKPVRIIATYPAGGLSDLMARLAGQILTDALGKPFIVEHRPGASGVMTGTEYVPKSPADGYTLLMGSFGPMTTAPATWRRRPSPSPAPSRLRARWAEPTEARWTSTCNGC